MPTTAPVGASTPTREPVRSVRHSLGEAMLTNDTRIDDLTRLRKGHWIQAWLGRELRYVGVVDLLAPDLGMVWIREGNLGERKLLDASEYTLYWCTPFLRR